MKRHMSLGGDYSGEVFQPLEWFKRGVRAIYGNLTSEGLRLVEDVYWEVPKGSAKTTNIAALVLTELCLTKTSGTEIYSAATVKKQAANTYRAAEQMVNASPVLRQWLKCVPSYKRIVRRDDPTSFYEALSSDGDFNDGFAPQMVVRDELHLWRTKKSRSLFAILEKSARTKRKNPLIIDITTAGEKDNAELCWNRHEYCLKWMKGEETNKRFFGHVYCADQRRMDEEEGYWMTKEARVLANPAHEDHGGHIKDRVLADMVDKAKHNALLKAEFLRYHLNYWGTNVDAVINYPRWAKCGGGIDMREWPVYDPTLAISIWGLADNPCVLGLDIGSSRDLTALVACFPPYENRTRWAFLAWYWMPQGKVAIRTTKDQVPYQDWVDKGFITAHAETKTDPRTVLPTIKWCRQFFRVRELAYDPWNADALIKRIKTGDEHGADAIDMECWEVRQEIGQLNEATKWIIDAPMDEEGMELIMHGNNPVLNWNARNLGVVRDSNNNVKPLKVGDESAKKIDGMAALITGLRRALLVAEESADAYVS